MLFISVTLLFLFSSSFPQQAFQYKFQQISSGNVLSNPNVHKIMQDRKGFLWFCTEDGLNKYDGYNFNIYKKEPHNNRSLSDNYIYYAYEDHDGIIWIATNEGGLNRFDPVYNQTEKYIYIPGDPSSISSNRLTTVLEDRAGSIWIGTLERGLNRFDKKTRKFSRYYHNPENKSSLSSNEIINLFVDKYGELWIGTRNGGLNRYIRETDSFVSYQARRKSEQTISNNNVFSFFETENMDDSLLWIGTQNGLNSFNRYTGKFTRYFHDNEVPAGTKEYGKNTILSILEVQKGILWLATFDGIINLNISSGKYSRINRNSANPNSLTGDRILTLFKDRSGVIWVSILEKGVMKYNKRIKTFRHYKPAPEFENSLSQGPIRAIEEDSYGNLWIGTLGSGIDIVDPRYYKIQHLKASREQKSGLNSNEISSIHKDRSGNIWISSWTSGLNEIDSSQIKTGQGGRIDLNSLRFKSYKEDPDNPNSLQDNLVQAIYSSTHIRRGVLWIGTGYGLDVFDNRNKSFRHIVHDPNDPNSLSDNSIQSKCILQDKENNLWIGTWNGLNKIESEEVNAFLKGKNSPVVKRFLNDPRNENSLSDNRILSIHEDKDGILWIGTHGGGLNRMIFLRQGDKKKDTIEVKNYSTKDGLPNDVIYGILEDEDNNLWLSTNNGLSRFDKKNETFRNYTQLDGLQSNKFYWGAFCKRKNGEMIFGGINGFNAFFPREITTDTVNAPVLITSFNTLGNMKKLHMEVYAMKEISLPYDNNFFSFEFASFDFLAPEKNEYSYILEGFDKNWINSGNRRFASYTNVNPGEYTFRVRGTNSNGQWNESEASIRIVIIAPYWQTIWFRILSVILITCLLFFLYKRRVRKVEKRNLQLTREIEYRRKVEEQLIRAKESAERSDRLRSEFLAQMSHEIRTPVNSILSFTSLLRSELEDNVPDDLKQSFLIIENGGRRLIRTIDMILNMSAIQAGAFEINPVTIDLLKNVLEPLVGEFASPARVKNLDLKLYIRTDRTLIFADLYTVTQIFANLIDNAIKYTRKGHIAITVEQTAGNTLTVKFEDTGVGIAKEFIPYLFDAFTQEETGYTRRFEGTGLGLSLVKKFAEMNNAKIDVQSEKGKGTTFTVIFNYSGS